ncbi:MAG: carbohydrate ABC transporter permease [Actinobacteria bacterium]|nr:carbohydrate ABC transporter permease [Actinomycetota bacterium]
MQTRISQRFKIIFGGIFKHAFLIIILVTILAPFIWTLSSSFKSPEEIIAYPPSFIPQDWTIQNYINVLTEARFFRYILNTAIVTSGVVILSVIASMFAGYAAARFRFRFKGLIMFFVLAGSAIGRFANAMPLYFLSVKLKLYDTYYILIIAGAAFVIPTLMWLMMAYIQTIPKELEEAAKIDGCNNWTSFWKVLVPAIKPPIIAAVIIAMVYSWNEFILALLLTKSVEVRTLTLALYSYLTEMGVQWGQLTSASILSQIPILVVFFLLQRYFIQGLTAGTLGAE